MKEEKLSLYTWTFITDIIVLCILIFNLGELNTTEYIFLCSIILIHSLFYYCLYYDKTLLLRILHYTIAILLAFGFFTINIYILILILVFTLALQLQWIFTNKCLLNIITKVDNNLIFAYITKTITLLYTCYLSFKIGYVYNGNNL